MSPSSGSPCNLQTQQQMLTQLKDKKEVTVLLGIGIPHYGMRLIVQVWLVWLLFKILHPTKDKRRPLQHPEMVLAPIHMQLHQSYPRSLHLLQTPKRMTQSCLLHMQRQWG